MVRGAEEVLGGIASLADIEVAIEAVIHSPGGGEGGSVVIWAETEGGGRLGASALMDRKVSAEAAGRQAARELVESLAGKACVDEHLQDQLIIFMALADGSSSSSKLRTGKLSLHTQTAIHFAEAMTGAKFTVTEEEGGAVIECRGSSYGTL
ncbi:hypothetical protein T484DRAFT_1936571 [Baffinella frigidus]|nr:hypothetical protein T484DRAFT_1936571 [Cryptophyta sp. CCMP2293]